jgi:pilus assembly protein CpaB
MAMRTEDPQSTARDGRKKKVPVRAILLLTAAALAALGTALLLTKYMDARLAAARVPTTKVVVAAVDIPLADPIDAQWLKAVDWPTAVRPEGAVSDPAAVVGKVAMTAIAKGEPVLASKLVVAGARRGLATIVPEGMRAVAVKVDEVVGVAGFVQPGDRVDVVVTMRPRDDGPFVARIVLQNVQVLAVGKEIEARGKDAKEAKTVTVATLVVTSEESERLALSTDRGHILLALRGIGDEEVAETRGITPPLMMLTSAPPPEPPKETTPIASNRSRARTRAQVPVRHETPAAVAPPERQVVEVIRGDMFEKRAFDADRQEKRP